MLAVLRLGLAQVLHLDVPDHAAVSTSLQLVEQAKGGRAFKGLVNAVLRGIARERPPEPPLEAYAPPWLYARWRSAYGEARAQAMAARLLQEPPTDLSLRDPGGAAALAEALPGVVTGGGTVRTARRGDLTAWPGFEAGAWWVQDAAAAVPTRLLGVQAGARVLDLCAAPGGKALQLAALGAQVTAVDRSPRRLQRLAENLARVGLPAEVVAADAATWEDARLFDAVLLDAPCSATGAFRRNPDVLWAARPGDIGKLAAVQAALLDSAARRLKPGGRLVYAVCSLEPEEGEAIVSAFLARASGFRRAPIRPGEGGAPEAAATPAGDLRLTPDLDPPGAEGGLDGFFVARLERVA